MSRLLPVLLSSSLGLAAIGCNQAKGVEMEAKQLVPADAQVAFGFSFDAVRGSPIGPAIAAAMRGERDLAAMMDAAPKCNVSVDAMQFFFAGKLDSEDDFVAIVESPGIGDEDLVKCVEDEMRKVTGGKDGILLFSTRGDVRTTPQEGGGYLIILNKNTIVVVGRSWEDAVFAAIEKPVPANAETELGKALARVDVSAHLWVAAAVEQSDVADMEIAGSDAIRSVAVSMDLSKGLGLDTTLGFTEADKAGSFRTALPELMTEVSPALGEVGLPTDLLDSLEIGGEGPVVSAKLQIGSEALPGLVATMGVLMAQP